MRQVMNLKKYLLVFYLLVSIIPAATAAVPDQILNQISSLEPKIGGWPPNIKSKSERLEVEKKYEGVKKLLDKALMKNPEDVELLFQRGRLQTMGHNMDLPGSWDGAEADFLAILKKDPKNENAMVELGNLYVNSDPRLAPKAEKLFINAQEVHGSQPLEGAQRGLFFAFYYQGRMKEALSQAEFLTKTWPNNKMYLTLLDTTRSVLERKKDQK
jgi:tetratricopeptide (TPR) repeat protein